MEQISPLLITIAEQNFIQKNSLAFLCILAGILVMASLLLALYAFNKFYKKTHHWRNKFAFQSRFMPFSCNSYGNERKYDIVNLGSNPAMFGFFYADACGQNWATGSQGLPMDFEILKSYHSHIKEGGVVLIPIMPFTAISQYLKTKPAYWSDYYYMNFASILAPEQVNHLGNIKKNYLRMLKYPVFYNLKLVRFILRDIEKDRTLEISEQSMQVLELEQDANKWINGWLKEFDVRSMEGFYGGKFHSYIEEGVGILREMIDFCLDNKLKPVLITLPMTAYLDGKFSEEFKQKLVKDFVSAANTKNVIFLDYWGKHILTDPSLYMNSFFFYLRGRKIFTKKVLTDLGLL